MLGDTGNKRAVRILPECILVYTVFKIKVNVIKLCEMVEMFAENFANLWLD